MKIKISTLLAILFFTTFYAQQNTISESISVEIGQSYKIQSHILKEERTLLIHTPASYKDSNKKYPVIYVLDGNNHFSHSINAATLLAENGRMPESIIVAIPNNQGTRGRDLESERDTFKEYIKKEVISFVSENYRTLKNKTLFGHSMAGAFALNYLATEPGLFDNYIAASPVIQIFNSELLTKFQELFKREKTVNKPLYFTLTEVEAEGNRATEAMNKFVDLLEKEAPKTLRWKYDFIENQIHMTTPYLTIYKGFTEVFYDFQSPSYTSFKEYTDRGGMPQLKTYYANRAVKYQSENVIPENTMRRLANMLLNDKQENLALELLEQNTKTHVESFPALNSLARAYERLNKLSEAKKVYQTALSLAEKQASPNTAYFKRQLNRLDKK
tara:strand:- start:37267 stop:38427 length:1161 start_codon:yes stop_codon:yes gene_type:complete